MPTRLSLLEAWFRPALQSVFARAGWGSAPPGTLTAIGSDASFRHYWRWQGGGHSLIVMDAAPPQEDCRPFVRIAKWLSSIGLRVPQILESDFAQGFLLLDDLGRETFLDVLNERNADALFASALQSLLRLQCAPRPDWLKAYDAALLSRELQLFPDWYLARHLGVTLDKSELAAWQRICAKLIESALAQTQVAVHRDYMPRNLMPGESACGILDFQDAVCGPITYDVTCLFKDAFISWPEVQVEIWLHDYWKQAARMGLGVPPSFAQFQQDSDLMGVQRHLKVIGIFSRICYRDGKPKYLADIPRFFAYLHEVLARRPELAELAALLADLPAFSAARRTECRT